MAIIIVLAAFTTSAPAAILVSKSKLDYDGCHFEPVPHEKDESKITYLGLTKKGFAEHGLSKFFG